MAFRSSLISVGKIINNGLIIKSCNVRSMVVASKTLDSKKSSSSTPDIPTHTGQVFEKDDYRLVRFIDKEKQVNQDFAIDLINEVPPNPAKARVVWCDGGVPSSPHPRVYINLDEPGNHTCGYCGLRFFKDGSSHH